MTERDAAPPLTDDPSVARLVEALTGIEETLRDLAYDRLREDAEGGATKASDAQRRLEQARRGVAKALKALDPDRPDLF
ncbi:MAG TPA: hypothetical protein VM618_06465 [Acidimicrobiia bacterium]|nr:hypothetical protein [Acidimicrobiia bacterium]